MDRNRHNGDEFSIGFIRRPTAGYGCSQSIFDQQKGETLSGFNTLGRNVAMIFKVWRNPATNEMVIPRLDLKPTLGRFNSITPSLAMPVIWPMHAL